MFCIWVPKSYYYKSIEQPLRAENSVGAGQPSEKQTIKTLEEAPEGPPLNVIVKAQSSETLKLSWKVLNFNSYTIKRRIYRGAVNLFLFRYCLLPF